MCDTWVINASPLILYGRIQRLDLVAALASVVIVPATVIEEVSRGMDKDSTAAEAVEWAAQYRQKDIAVPTSIERWDLGPGESQVISFCLQDKGLAILDDRMARRCIQAQGLRVTGSLGVILMARKHGLIEAARPWVYKLIGEGMHIDTDLAENALASIGEGA